MADVVVSTNNKQKFNWRTVIIVVVVILVALGLGAGLRLLQQDKNQNAAKKTAQETVIDKTVSQAQDTAVSGDYDKAHSQLNEALKQPGLTSEQKYNIIFQQGVTYENQAMYQQAIDSYTQAAQIKENNSVYEALGRTAEAMGNKEQAITYYKKAITLIPPQSEYPLAGSTKTHYEESIKSLGGQP